MEQPQYNMLVRERFEKEYEPLYRDLGYGTTIWSPLASGILTGKYNDGVPEGSRANLKGYEWLQKLDATAGVAGESTPVEADRGRARLHAWRRWRWRGASRNPNVSTVITGASRPEQVRENMKALDVVPLLTDEVEERIEAILANKPK